MMDKCIVVKGKHALCIPIRQVKKGDKIIVGENGVKIPSKKASRRNECI